MTPLPYFRGLLLAVLLACTTSVRAHPGHYHPDVGAIDEFEKRHALEAGWRHPLTGADHLLPLVAIGLAAGLAGRSRARAAAALALGICAGGMVFAAGVTLPGQMPASIGCTVAAAISLLLDKRTKRWLVPLLAACFGLWQGNAQALIVPAPSLLLSYGIGFVAAALVILGAAMLLGDRLQRRALRPITRPAATV